MKGLAAGLIFVTAATLCALLLGLAVGGLNPLIAFISFIAGFLFAAATYLGTADVNRPSPNSSRYSRIWLWGLGAVFTIFAVRSFCWLLYIDGSELKIQSPNNLGDLALHITYIKNFANGVALWPDNPIYVASKMRYPAGTDLFNALLYIVHVDLTRGLVWAGLLGSLATFYAFWRWGGMFGIAGFLFNGGVMGFQFINTHQFQDYQGNNTIAWKSIPLAMFVTQRGWLYAIPAGLLLLWHWREKFFRNQGAAASQPPIKTNGGLETAAPWVTGPLPFAVELALYASLPLFTSTPFSRSPLSSSFYFCAATRAHAGTSPCSSAAL